MYKAYRRQKPAKSRKKGDTAREAKGCHACCAPFAAAAASSAASSFAIARSYRATAVSDARSREERAETHRTRRELRLGPDPRPIPIEQERARREEQRAQPDERARPVDAQPLEHLHGEERERGADRGADDRVRGERGCAVLQVRVDEVRLRARILVSLPARMRSVSGANLPRTR